MIASLFVLTTISIYSLVRNVFHPAFMMLFFWTFGIIALSITPGFYYPSIETLLIIYLYILLFSLISFFTFNVIKHKNQLQINHVEIDTNTLNFISAFLFVGLVLYLYRYIELIRSFNTLSEYFFRIRYAAIHSDEPLIVTGALLTQVKTFSSILSLVLFYETYRRDSSIIKKAFLFSFIALALAANIVEGSRNEFVLLSISYSSLYVMMKGPKSIIKAIFIFMVVFFVLSILTRGSGFKDGAFISYLLHLSLYSFGTIISFESFLAHDISVSSSIMVKACDHINSLLGIFTPYLSIIHPPVQQAEFTSVSPDASTNVYSFLAVRIYYFGFFGAAISILVHAILITYTYAKSPNNIIFFICYLLMIPTTILSLFHEFFFPLIPYYIRAFFLLGLLYYIKPSQILKRILSISVLPQNTISHIK